MTTFQSGLRAEHQGGCRLGGAEELPPTGDGRGL